MTSLLKKQGTPCMPCSAKFSMPVRTEILSTETSDFPRKNHFSQISQFRVYFKVSEDNILHF